MAPTLSTKAGINRLGTQGAITTSSITAGRYNSAFKSPEVVSAQAGSGAVPHLSNILEAPTVGPALCRKTVEGTPLLQLSSSTTVGSSKGRAQALWEESGKLCKLTTWVE